MSNSIYTPAKVLLLTAGENLGSATLKMAAVSSSYSHSTSDQYYTSISAAVLGTPVALSSVTTTGGKFTSAAVTISDVPNTDTVSYLVIYQDTGSGSTSPLLAFFDTAGSGSLPITSNGGSLQFSPDGTNGWFTL